MLNNAEWYNGDDHEGYCQGGILYINCSWLLADMSRSLHAALGSSSVWSLQRAQTYMILMTLSSLPSITFPLLSLTHITCWLLKVMINTGPCSIIFPSYNVILSMSEAKITWFSKIIKCENKYQGLYSAECIPFVVPDGEVWRVHWRELQNTSLPRSLGHLVLMLPKCWGLCLARTPSKNALSQN